ncbi:hypothetical protein KCU71_g1441, partial [Aureobasidium melanogenum]
MCDPFNTSIEAALWDERHDLDPFMAEHYAINAQHELDRLAVSQPFSAHIAHVRRLHADYSTLAATAQLPNDSDFEESESAEELESQRMAFVHPNRLALMSSAREEIAPAPSQTQRRSPANVSANVNNSVVPRNARSRRRRRESSVESIVREDGFDSHGDYHHDHVDHHQWMQEHAAPFNYLPPLQALAGFFQLSGQYGGNTYHYAPTITVVNNYYGSAPPQQPQYGFDHGSGQDGAYGGGYGGGQERFSGGSGGGRGRGRVRDRGRGGN